MLSFFFLVVGSWCIVLGVVGFWGGGLGTIPVSVEAELEKVTRQHTIKGSTGVGSVVHCG